MASFISKLIGKRSSSQDLAELVGNTMTDLVAAREQRATLEEQRSRLLIEGTDAEVDALDGQISEATRTCDRLAAALDALEERIEAAQEAEREGYLDALAALGEALATKAMTNYGAYERMARDIVDLATLDSAIDRRLTDVNQLLAEAGRPKVRQPEYRATTRRDGNAGPGVSRRLKLPNPADAFDPLYPIGQPELRNEAWSAATARLDREVGRIPAAPEQLSAVELDGIEEAA